MGTIPTMRSYVCDIYNSIHIYVQLITICTLQNTLFTLDAACFPILVVLQQHLEESFPELLCYNEEGDFQLCGTLYPLVQSKDIANHVMRDQLRK